MSRERTSEDVFSDPIFVRTMREKVYELTLKRLNRSADDDEDADDARVADQIDEDDEDEDEDEKLKVEPAELEAFLAAAGRGPERALDLGALESAVAGLPDPADRPADAAEALTKIIDCMQEVVDCLGDLKHRYAILWARCRLAQMLEADQKEDENHPEFTFNVGGHSHRITLPMEVDAEEKKELDELVSIINQRTTNVARADDVFVKVRKRESPFDRFLLVQGAENMDMEVTSVKPFSKKRLADPSYLAAVVTAVNAATAVWRSRASRTPEDLQAQYERKKARIERKFPQYWGPEGVGAMICTLGALLQCADVARFPDVEALPGEANDPHACFAAGLPALRTLSARLDEKLREEGDSLQDLADVQPVRQFFLSPFLSDFSHVPDEARPVAALVHGVIAQEVELDRSRRSAHTSTTTETSSRLIQLAYVANREFVDESPLGTAVIRGNCELVRVEPSKKVTNEKRLLKLLNSAFDTASRSRTLASMTLF